jgi:hypothetical protein
MSWMHDLAYLESAVRSGYVGSQVGLARPRPALWGSPYRSYGRPSVSWPQLLAGSPTASQSAKTQAPAGFPEKINISLPTPRPEGAPPPPPIKPTTGDFFGSIGATLEDIGRNVNLANVIPWVQERSLQLAKEFNVPVLKEGLSALLGGMEWISNIAGPVLDALPNWAMNNQLNDRIALAKALASGDDRAIAARMTGGLDFTAQAKLLGRAMSQPGRPVLDEETKALLYDALDLPDQVKEAIRRNPAMSDAEANRLLDEVGRSWSYKNPLIAVGVPLIVYGGEAALLSVATGGLGTVGMMLGLGPRATTALSAVGRAGSLAARFQRDFMAANLGLAGLSAGLETIARFQGNQAAIDWFERLNQPSPYAENPNVQLTTSFLVNPLAAVNRLRKGVLTLAHGTGEIVLGKTLGDRLLRVHDSDELLYGAFGRIMKVGDADQARLFAEQHGWDRGRVFNFVLNVALDEATSRLPKEEQVRIAALQKSLDHAKGQEFLLKRFGKQAIDIIEREPGTLAARIQEHAWSYHGYLGRFDPELALLNNTDYVQTQLKTAELRSKLDAVVAYREVLPPEGAQAARQLVDEWASPDGTIKVPGVHGVDDLIRQFPALREQLRRAWVAEGRPEAMSVQAVRSAIDAAEADWQRLARENPIKAATGHDPILRPDSPDPVGDLAKALGADRNVIEAWSNADLSDTAVQGYRALLAKLGGEQMLPPRATPEQVWATLDGRIRDLTEPWYKTGERVAKIENLANSLNEQRLKLLEEYGGSTKRMPKDVRDEYAVLTARAEGARRLIAEIDPSRREQPIGTATERMRGRQRLIAAESQWDAFEQQARLSRIVDELEALDAEVATLYSTPSHEFGWLRDWRKNPVTGEWGLAGPVRFSKLVRLRIADWMQRHGFPAHEIESVREWSDAEILADIWSHDSKLRGWYEQLPEDSNLKRQIRWNSGFRPRLDEMYNPETIPGPAGDDAFLHLMQEKLDRYEQLMAEASDVRGRRTVFRHPHEIYRVLREAGLPDWAFATRPTVSFLADEGLDDPAYIRYIRGQALRLLDDWLASEPRPSLPQELHAILNRDETIQQAIIEANPDLDFLHFGHEPTPDEIVAAALAEPERLRKAIEPLIAQHEEAILGQIDRAIMSGDRETVMALSRQAEEAKPVKVRVPERIVKLAAKREKPSTTYARLYHGVGGHLADALSENAFKGVDELGLKGLGTLLYGDPTRRPVTVEGVWSALRMIERGEAKRLGFGTDLRARMQVAAYRILDNALNETKRAQLGRGVLRAGLDPAMLDEEDLALARSLLSDENRGLISFDPEVGVDSFQYGLARRPKAAILTELDLVPGLAEEFMLQHWQPWSERVWTAKLRQVWHYLFGPLRNTQIGAEARARFIDAMRLQGVPARGAAAIWEEWIARARESRPMQKVRTPTGELQYRPGENPLYATARNIPTNDLGAMAQQALAEWARINGVPFDTAWLKIDFGAAFREATSSVRRFLAELPGPLGPALANAYGAVAHNSAATTFYFWFRFKMDIRFHAMNFLEGMFLYAGRAGLLPERLKRPLFGQTEEVLAARAVDAMGDTSFPFSRTRMGWAARAFRKEQLARLEQAVMQLDKEHPGIMRQVLRDLAENDPELAQTIQAMDDTPEGWLRALDEWHAKMLDAADPASAIDEAVADATHASPELAEVLQVIGDANKQLWDDIRHTFYGNAERSRVERWLNSYLLFWPLSYQIKAGRWLMRILFDRAGGIRTNSAGAWLYADAMRRHEELVANDPEYQQWLERHKTLLFVAQMLFPITPSSMGVTLNPALRSLFFGRRKAIWDIGPIYTATELLPAVAKELYYDAYPAFRDVPGFEGLYRALTGREPPKVALPPPPAELPPSPVGVPG